jgi:hypothetical protein
VNSIRSERKLPIREKLQALGFWDGNERPATQELHNYAQSVLTAKAKAVEIIAGAIAVKVNIPPEFESQFPDGIRVHVESPGFSRLIYQPYVIKKVGFLARKQVTEYGEMFSADVGLTIFI